MDKAERLDKIWNKTADVLERALDAKEPSALMVQAAIRFLKDNEVEKLPAPAGRFDAIMAGIPFPKYTGTGDAM